MNVKIIEGRSFTPKYFECYNRTFILNSHRNETSFWSWVALLGNQIHNNQYYVKLRLWYQPTKNQPLQSIVSDVFTHSSVRGLPCEVLKAGRCLELSTTTLPDSYPPCVWFII